MASNLLKKAGIVGSIISKLTFSQMYPEVDNLEFVKGYEGQHTIAGAEVAYICDKEYIPFGSPVNILYIKEKKINSGTNNKGKITSMTNEKITQLVDLVDGGIDDIIVIENGQLFKYEKRGGNIGSTNTYYKMKVISKDMEYSLDINPEKGDIIFRKAQDKLDSITNEIRKIRDRKKEHILQKELENFSRS